VRIIVGGEKKKAYTPKRTKQSGSELKKKASMPKRPKKVTVRRSARRSVSLNKIYTDKKIVKNFKKSC
jgi:hypothetical protein